MGATIEDLADLAHVLDRALYGIVEMSSHSMPVTSWEDELLPISSLAAELNKGLRALKQRDCAFAEALIEARDALGRLLPPRHDGEPYPDWLRRQLDGLGKDR